MSSLLLPRHFYNQPQGAVQSSANAVRIWMPDIEPVGKSAALYVGTSPTPCELGVCLPSNGSSTYGYHIVSDKIINPVAWTIIAAIKPANTTQTNKWIFGLGSSASNNQIVGLTQEGANLGYYARNDANGGGVSSLTFSLDAALTTGWHVVGFSTYGTITNWAIDGQAITPRATAGQLSGTYTLNRLGIGAMVRATAALHWAGACAFGYLSNEALTMADLAERTATPWQTFRVSE